MKDVIYSTDSDEHKINTGEKTCPQQSLMDELDLELQINDSWDLFMERTNREAL